MPPLVIGGAIPSLLHTSTIKLSEFYGDDIPDYAILSHTWGKAEVLFHDLQKNETSKLDGLEGYRKIKACCAEAAEEEYQYVWIDTCCIDKTSCAELSEAINSMYRWYQDAQICYAYLVDVCIGEEGSWSPRVEQDFNESRWFTRGWTLQELLAPEKVMFYDRDWQYFGSKLGLRAEISLITGIQPGHIVDTNRASAAQKMSWASRRKTTRSEDMAYSSMGIFDVTMPLLYGEGERAFTRLQHETVKISDDESIFAWADGGFAESGIFAQSPKAFAESGDVVQINDHHRLYVDRAPYTVTNKGLAIEVFASEENEAAFISDSGISFVPLNCGRQPESGADSVQQLLTIKLKNISRKDFVRSSPGQLNPPMWPIDGSCTRLVYIRPTYHEQQQSFSIKRSSLFEHGFSILDTYGCQPMRYPSPYFKITLCGRQSFGALLLKNSRYGLFALILRVYKGTPGIDLIVPSTAQTFEKEMDKYNQIIRSPTSINVIATRRSRKLQDTRRISVTLKKRRAGTYQSRFFVEFEIPEE